MVREKAVKILYAKTTEGTLPYAFTITISNQHSSCLALGSSISRKHSTRLVPAFTSALFTQINLNKFCYSYRMDRRIAGFHQDEENFWVAELECGHKQHVRHKPPMTLRPWVNDENGRKERVGTFLSCKACDSESI